MISHCSYCNFTKLNSSIHPLLSIASSIVYNIIFTSTLDDKELQKDLFVTIVNEKELTCFIILHYIMDKEGPYMAHL